MRTTIIPAQITTVEDKIAGSLNMTQILIMMFPILWTAIIYILLAPSMKLVGYKLTLILFATSTCLILAFRIKEKIVAEWLGILVTYRLRPKYWLFNKNDTINRTIDILELPVEHILAIKHAKKSVVATKPGIGQLDQLRLEHLINSGKVAVHYQFEKKHL